MTTTKLDSSPSTNQTQPALLFIEWAALLGGLLLCMPADRFYSGLYLVIPLLTISWTARWVRLRRPTRATPVDVPLLLFLVSLLVSFFAAPNPQTAFARLMLFLVAFSLFYALINSPLRTISAVLNLFIILMAFSGPILVSQYDWSLGAPRFSSLASIGIVLNRLLPDLNLELPAWDALRNILASLLGLFLPILVLQLYRGFKEIEKPYKYSPGWVFSIIRLSLLILSGLLILMTLILTGSRAPWLVYAAVTALIFWWWLSRRIAARFRFSYGTIFLSGVFAAGLLLIVLLNFLPEDTALVSLLPGPDTLTGRMEIYPQSYYLAGDTPYTGGGLGAFTPLYSFYIRVTPFNAFLSEDTGVNLYLYILVEQGWLGLIALMLLLIIPLASGTAHIDSPDLRDKGLLAVGIIGIMILTGHGFIHALSGASRAIPFLLLPAGLVFAGMGSAVQPASRSANSIRQRAIVLIVLLPPLAYLLLAPAPRAAWYANLGALRMARVQLAGWPPEAWEDGSRLPDLAPAQALFHQALALNPQNRTANHRLGLIALLRQDFPMAVSYLETAHTANPDHRGITKSLGYARVWAGEVERGLELLRSIPETPQELDAYIFFWQTLDRPDVSDLAAEARARLSK